MNSVFIHFTDEVGCTQVKRLYQRPTHKFQQYRWLKLPSPSRRKQLTLMGHAYIFPMFEILWGCITFVTNPHRNGVFYLTGPWKSRERSLPPSAFCSVSKACQPEMARKWWNLKRLITINHYEKVAYYRFINSE